MERGCAESQTGGKLHRLWEAAWEALARRRYCMNYCIRTVYVGNVGVCVDKLRVCKRMKCVCLRLSEVWLQARRETLAALTIALMQALYFRHHLLQGTGDGG